MKLNSVLTLLFIALFTACKGGAYDLSGYGLKPDTGENASPLIAKALQEIAAEVNFDTVRILLPKGRYDFYPEGASKREYFISNHDQDNPKLVGLAFENMKNVIFDGQGSELVFHGRMLPVSLVGSENCTLKNFSIDFANPHISQVKVLENDTVGGLITYEVAPWVEYEIRDSNFVAKGEGWEHVPAWGIAFEGDTKRLVYTTSDISVAQMSENITLDKFSVCLRGKDDPRYFTTQADATHFSGCKGLIRSVGGLYEGMMDDAINVHGTYLKVQKRIDDKTLVGEYMHGQSYGFEWGRPGDAVQFIESKTMEVLGEQNKVAASETADKPDGHGVKQFRITFETPVDPAISEVGTYGIENQEWTPEVYFADNVIRNNRARGSLFSTPKKTVVEKNVFDHTSGTAILLCGDCNGWFETGACHDVQIRNNKFINALTNQFQFTNAVISIYPEIPDLKSQKRYFHSGIVIEDNEFETFDMPILYAKSVDGLVFRNNVIRQNHDYPAFHWNNHRFFFQRVVNVEIKDNRFDGGFDEEKDIRSEE